MLGFLSALIGGYKYASEGLRTASAWSQAVDFASCCGRCKRDIRINKIGGEKYIGYYVYPDGPSSGRYIDNYPISEFSQSEDEVEALLAFWKRHEQKVKEDPSHYRL